MMSRKINILIADDSRINRSLLIDILSDYYNTIEAENGREVLSKLKQEQKKISLVLLDILMPEMDGFEVLEEMKKHTWGKDIPVIIISSETSVKSIRKGFEYGVSDYINKPFDHEIVLQRVQNTIMLHEKLDKLKQTITQQMLETEKNNTLMVDILSSIVEFRNGESGLHVIRIRIITEILLEEIAYWFPKYKITKDKISLISNAAALHDIGKISIAEEILNKPGRLSTDEFEIMKKHTIIGDEMLTNIKFGQQESLINYSREICRWHHERWDGKGYPDGLKEMQIPISAQIVALADVYDALVSERVYKKTICHEEAVKMILNGECGVFNPDLIKCFKQVSSHLLQDIEEHSLKQERIFNLYNIMYDKPEVDDIAERTMVFKEKERIKYLTLASISSEVSFDYEIDSDTITFYGRHEEEFGIPKKISNCQNNLKKYNFFDKKTIEIITRKVLQNSNHNQLIKEIINLKAVNGKINEYELVIKLIYYHDSVYGVIGRISKVVKAASKELNLEGIEYCSYQNDLYNQVTGEFLVSRDLIFTKPINAAVIFFKIEKRENENTDLNLLKLISTKINNKLLNDEIVAGLDDLEIMVYLKEDSQKLLVDKYQGICKLVIDTLNGNYKLKKGMAFYPQDGISCHQLLNYAKKASLTME